MSRNEFVLQVIRRLVVSTRDEYPRDGNTYSYVASFAEVEVDVETGEYRLVDFLTYADVSGGCPAILNALSDALGDEVFRRAPVTADTILAAFDAGRPMQHPLMAHI